MATTKISELNPLLSGSTCADAVLPVVNDGVTDKISIDNLRGTLRGASNQGPANAALNGGLNNTACRLGDGVFGGQANTVNANFKARTAAQGTYYWPDAQIESSGSLATIIGGLGNKIDIASVRAKSAYPVPTSTIISSVGTCITGSATCAYEVWYPTTGGDIIVGAHASHIVGPTANGNYANGLNVILGGYCHYLDFQYSAVDEGVANIGNGSIGGISNGIKRISGSLGGWVTANVNVGGAYNTQFSTNTRNHNHNTNLGGSGNRIQNSSRSTIIGGTSNVIEPVSACDDVRSSTVIGGRLNCIKGLGDVQTAVVGGRMNCIISCNTFPNGAILGGCTNTISGSVRNAAIAGGCCVTASVNNALHINQLVFKTGISGIPTSDPGVAGQVWNDAGTLKIS